MTEALTLRMWNAQQGHTVLKVIWTHAKAWLTAGHRLIIEIRQETRSDAQNKLLHALIGDVSKQVEWMGKKRTALQWKVLLVSGHSVATNQGAELVPGIEGEFVNIRESTARMSKSRVNSLIEYIYAFGSSHDIEWREAKQWMVDEETGEYYWRQHEVHHANSVRSKEAVRSRCKPALSALRKSRSPSGAFKLPGRR